MEIKPATQWSRPASRLALLAALLLACVASLGGGEPPTPLTPAEEEEKNRRRELIERSAADLKLFMGADREVELEACPDPLLRWPNVPRGTPDGATYLWTAHGRPEAIACVWWCDGLCYAFGSLSTRPLTAEKDGTAVWYPSSPGITFDTFADAPAPAKTAAARLSQMKTLVRRFSAAMLAHGQHLFELRLLPQPLFRYESDQSDLLDGALFAFVDGTDPDVIVLVEARHNSNGDFEWQYAISRRAMGESEVRYQDKTIWSVKSDYGQPDQPFFESQPDRTSVD